MSGEYVFGWHAVEAVLKREPERLQRVWIQTGRQDKRVKVITDALNDLGVRWQVVHRKELDERVAGVHQGIVAAVSESREWTEDDLLAQLAGQDAAPFLLVLDGVTDPHNLGACMRTADAVGVQAVIVPKDKSASLTPVARKVACGAAETVPFVRVTNLARFLRTLKDQGVWLIGTAGEAKATLFQADFKGPVALVMGAEGKGMRRLTREHCDQLINIPMLGHVDSLNVSVATGVCLYEALRQRLG
ncbi:23S rRNA (guanosine(2251)-2'-O)-methyltransferase RlmB [Marinobacter qingdaonensis]|uniref:23S rRNA (guanosine-2'-O-)-methyltransferase RlmB n=1 Tax=Marinobacter qingdaonensis TaxID=3108486 RepID=A0ABU5NUX7_9GAMM|nr:23S rRNA (guanosine(2251)-2'-O)-methyltransferase RlmB [Marinobacter sp. ASW11-75]MCS5563903.1 23S rRNA (guanosine(2251)-2'-O)-methyltransferase RlmB [Oleiphilaceae bacterium]MEA1079572.1 23S rRNA (guanosine(2251)-2'-O)-methyltransferase RlmB [Marinobacter sp. ASW11-75]MEE2763273.1 23S rRNA (guanosine(2251)-2'-O)-methyltransferase RlmB [Pseudomonadota bacterium]